MTNLDQASFELGDWHARDDDARGFHRVELDASFLRARWRRCSLTADAWAAYLADFVPVGATGLLRPEDIRSALSYVINELIENTAKFSSGEPQPVVYEGWLSDETAIVSVTNQANPGDAARLLERARDLFEGDPSAMYVAHMEAAAESGTDTSGIGLLTLVLDYGLELAFRFTPATSGNTTVAIQARLSLGRG